MDAQFVNTPFMRPQSQEFHIHVIYNAYDLKETSLNKTLRLVPIKSVADAGNIISRHTLYTFRVNDDGCVFLKAHIGPQGNEYYLLTELCSECAMCSPSVTTLMMSTAALFRVRLHNVYMK